MRLRVKHTASIDGVEPGDVGEFADNPGTRVLLEAGLLAPVTVVPGPGLEASPRPRPDATPRRKG